MVKVYGIPNCNTVKNAMEWLKANQIEFEFHNFKKLGISESKLKEWSDQVGWEALINKRGTTWKKLDVQIQENIVDEKSAFAIMQEKTSLIKRPVIETSNAFILGFDEERYRELLSS